jgi:hypothetical protein
MERSSDAHLRVDLRIWIRGVSIAEREFDRGRDPPCEDLDGG